MGHLPRIKITLPFDNVAGDYYDLEEAEHRFEWDNDSFIIMAEGQVITSYEELVRLASQERYADAEFLELHFLPTLYGG